MTEQAGLRKDFNLGIQRRLEEHHRSSVCSSYQTNVNLLGGLRHNTPQSRPRSVESIQIAFETDRSFQKQPENKPEQSGSKVSQQEYKEKEKKINEKIHDSRKSNLQRGRYKKQRNKLKYMYNKYTGALRSGSPEKRVKAIGARRSKVNNTGPLTRSVHEKKSIPVPLHPHSNRFNKLPGIPKKTDQDVYGKCVKTILHNTPDKMRCDEIR